MQSNLLTISTAVLLTLFGTHAAFAEETSETAPAVTTQILDALAPIPSPSRHFDASIGYEYLSDTTTPGQEANTQFLPIGFTAESENYVFEISIPYIQRSAPAGKVLKNHHEESGKKQSTTTPIVTNQGMGDITTSLQRSILKEETSMLNLSAKAEIKIATADTSKGLGTGVNDYFVEMLGSKTIEKFTAKASIGYAMLGTPGAITVNEDGKNTANVTLSFNNIYYGSLGAAYELGERLSANAGFEYGQAAETGGFEQQDLSGGVKFKFSDKQTLQLRAVKSMTAGLSIWGASISLSRQYD